MGGPEQLGKILNPESAKCENCGYGFRLYENEVGYRKWCKRCIDIFYRKQTRKVDIVEEIIFGLVGPKYTKARLDELADGVKEKLLALEHGRDVFFCGDVGVGKTYAMAALIRYYTYEGHKCEKINFDDFCVEVRSTMSPASKVTEWDMIKPLKEVDKLFIDDLGLKAEESQFTYGTFYSILNKRQERMLPTFVSSNKTIEQLGKTFDARIASRLRPALIIELTGQDRRKAG